ncbi:hypothetical protein HT031_003630 [Scenedesmus sp. PABB004]|nr:hypothetical protein HT031_003630 [Scenedesmus sp. PABB004]
MSVEERCAQFAGDAAARPKAGREIDKLRKFLHKNQGTRFTAKEQGHLFAAVGAYAKAAAAAPEPDAPALGLVEDALKMPFTVFTTAHKAKMLAWLDKLNGLEAAAAGGDGPAGAPSLTVLDVTADAAELMDAEGETQRVDLSVCDAELVARLRAAFERGDAELSVELGTRHGRPAIVKLTVG